MGNVYLEKQQEKYKGIRSAIEAIQTKAFEEKRDLTEDEFRSVTEQAAEAKKVADQIESLSDIETRNAKVGQLAASLVGDGQGGTEDDGAGGSEGGVRSAARTDPRDPGHYRSATDRGEFSFYGDHFRANALGDEAAARRMREYNQYRAVTQASGGTGTVLPKWLVDEYAAIARATRVVANLVRPIPLGDDPRPINMGRQTVGVDANITAQTTEGANNAAWGADRFATTSDVLTPNDYAVYQDVSRQFLASGTPTTDVIVAQDIMGAWNAKVETLVCTAIASAATAGTTFANEAAFQANTGGTSPAVDAVIDAQTAVANDKRGTADIAFMNYRRFGAFRKLQDTTGRKLMPVTRYNPQNAAGAMGNGLVGDIEGVDAYGTLGLDPTAYPEKLYVLRGQAVYLGESNRYDFTYDQVVGPSAVRMGTFGYVGVLVRYPVEAQAVTITAAT